MAGESDLGRLLSRMRPRLNRGRFVFVTVAHEHVPPGVSAVVTVREEEGTTLVLAQNDADRLGLAYDYVAAWITLTVHSALDAVGLTAAVATALAQSGLSCNVVAGYHHDHLFVPYERACDALATLSRLSNA